MTDDPARTRTETLRHTRTECSPRQPSFLVCCEVSGRTCVMWRLGGGAGPQCDHSVLIKLRPHTIAGLHWNKFVVPRGLEPRTLRLLAVRSNQLSYETMMVVFARGLNRITTNLS